VADTKIVFTPYWDEAVDTRSDTVVGRIAELVKEDASRNSPRGATGKLKASYGVVKPGKLRRWIGSALHYWRFVEKGTNPHTITAGDRARSGRKTAIVGVLAWPNMRSPHPVRRVRHPGAPAQYPLKRALYKKRSL
jgi:hypothetical protein